MVAPRHWLQDEWTSGAAWCKRGADQKHRARIDAGRLAPRLVQSGWPVHEQPLLLVAMHDGLRSPGRARAVQERMAERLPLETLGRITRDRALVRVEARASAVQHQLNPHLRALIGHRTGGGGARVTADKRQRPAVVDDVAGLVELEVWVHRGEAESRAHRRPQDLEEPHVTRGVVGDAVPGSKTSIPQ